MVSSELAREDSYSRKLMRARLFPDFPGCMFSSVDHLDDRVIPECPSDQGAGYLLYPARPSSCSHVRLPYIYLLSRHGSLSHLFCGFFLKAEIPSMPSFLWSWVWKKKARRCLSGQLQSVSWILLK